VDLDVGQAGVVIDHGVQVGGADHGPVVLAAAAGAPSGGLGVVPALDPAEEAPAAAVGDVGELGDVDVDQRAGVRVLVAADRLAADPVDVGSRLIWQRTNTACTVEADSPSCPAICTGPSRWRHRSRTIRRTIAGGVLVGLVWGRELRSTMPAIPSAR
jgi:hypothetical protein